MIVLTKENNIEIPNYDDLENKPSINGVVLEGNKTTEELGITIDTSEFVSFDELNEVIDNLEIQNIPYVVFGTPSSGNTPTVLAGNAEDVLYASRRKEPHFAYLYNGSINDYGASGELIQLTISSGLIGRQFEACKYDAVNSEIVKIIVFISPDLAYGGYFYTISNYRYKTATHSWVEANYQQKGNYLTSVPSEYVTETELNNALEGLGGTDIPTVVISNGDANSTTPSVIDGDLDAVINAIAENAPYIAYFVNVGTRFGANGKKYLIQAADFNELNNTGSLYYHTELAGGNHMDVQIFFRKENDVYIVFNIIREYHYYQEQLTSGLNIKTINGNSILGSGDLEITTDLSSYATTSYVDTQIGDINTILENIIG